MDKKSLEECEKLCQEYLKGWQRTKADFLNYKKQEAERMEGLLASVQAEYLLKMLELHDELERAREHMPEKLKNEDWVKGVLQIEDRFHSFFKEQGIERINPKGEQFDPNVHEAVAQIEAKDKKPGIVVEVMKKGYKIQGRLLRPAKVKVSK